MMGFQPLHSLSQLPVTHVPALGTHVRACSKHGVLVSHAGKADRLEVRQQASILRVVLAKG